MPPFFALTCGELSPVPKISSLTLPWASHHRVDELWLFVVVEKRRRLRKEGKLWKDVICEDSPLFTNEEMAVTVSLRLREENEDEDDEEEEDNED